jgi:hypothetical protein
MYPNGTEGDFMKYWATLNECLEVRPRKESPKFKSSAELIKAWNTIAVAHGWKFQTYCTSKSSGIIHRYCIFHKNFLHLSSEEIAKSILCHE